MAFVYLHHFPDGKYYVGSTTRPVDERWRDGFGYVSQSKIAKAIDKFGWSAIQHISFEVKSEETAKRIESFLISELNSIEDGYNTQAGIPLNNVITDCLTLRQCADEIGTTKNTIKYRAKHLPKECVLERDGMKFITRQGFELLKMDFKDGEETIHQSTNTSAIIQTIQFLVGQLEGGINT